ncbi:MAG: hypothetical protein NZ957_02395 [Thaumarchaeota archaeon]|nr:hypothetical protein [Candidatus Calditenuaceae archaeon]MDW8041731.1 hypothetical protein [Nitrososphaerota archaeon]
MRCVVRYWLMIAKDHRGRDGKPVSARAIVERRVASGVWFVSIKNPYLKKVGVGDRGIMLALGKTKRELLGDCTVIGGPFPIDVRVQSLIEGAPSSVLTHYLRIEGRLWPQGRDLKECVEKLSFVGDVSKWYVYFQGSLKPLTDNDVQVLMGR